MTSLVTGASGFVGQKLVQELLRRGENVRILHRPNSDVHELLDLGVESILGDVTDVDQVRKAVIGADCVYHLAGLIGYTKAMRASMEAVNVTGTDNVVRVLTDSRKTKLVYMSSVVAIGASFEPTPLNELSTYTIGALDLGYFETKRKAEELVVAAVKHGKIDAVIVNPSTIYGAGDAKKGSRKTQIKVAHGKMPFFTSGGVSVVSVHDVVAATLKAKTHGRPGERYILSGENLTIQQLFKYIAEAAGVAPPNLHLPNWLVHSLGWVGDRLEKFDKKGPLNSENAWTATLYHWFDHSKATRELDFNPRPARDAIGESVKWMLKNGY